MRKFLLIILLGLLNSKATLSQKENKAGGWSISVLPASVRVDPVTNKIIEERFSAAETGLSEKNLLEKNWIYDGRRASLKSARGEYISFQLVITNNDRDSILKNIKVEIPSLRNEQAQLKIKPELFLEWSVN